MLETFIITLREGVEAFLIVAVVMAYLAKTGRRQLFTPVYWAIGASIFASLGVAYAVTNLVNSELAEGMMALVAGVLVFTMAIHMIKAGKKLGKIIADKLEVNAQKAGKGAAIGIFAFVTLMITREGTEIVVLMQALALQTNAQEMIIGAVAGVIGAILVSIAWMKYSHLINLGHFLQVTAIFLILFSAHLFIYGIYEITETSVLPFSEETTSAIHATAKTLRKFVGYALIAFPFLWLGYALARKLGKKSASSEAAKTAA